MRPYPKLYEALGKKATLPNPNGRFLQATTATNAGTTVEAGLPNITGGSSNGGIQAQVSNSSYSESVTKAIGVTLYSSAAAWEGKTSSGYGRGWLNFDASRSSSVYGRSSTVQPPAYRVKYYIKAMD